MREKYRKYVNYVIFAVISEQPEISEQTEKETVTSEAAAYELLPICPGSKLAIYCFITKQGGC